MKGLRFASANIVDLRAAKIEHHRTLVFITGQIKTRINPKPESSVALAVVLAPPRSRDWLT
jgi:hypothetical protein